MAVADVRALVEYVVRGLVGQPDAVRVDAVERARVLVVEVRVAPDDVGKVIGRRGRVIAALRTVARTAAARAGRRVHVEIVQ